MPLPKNWTENLEPQKSIGWYEIFPFSPTADETQYRVSLHSYKGNGDKPTDKIRPGRYYVWWNGKEWLTKPQ